MPRSALLPPAFAAFQVLVLALPGRGRRPGLPLPAAARARAAWAPTSRGLCFALGPYLVGHLGDTATIVAAPLLPLLLIAAEVAPAAGAPARVVGLAVCARAAAARGLARRRRAPASRSSRAGSWSGTSSPRGSAAAARADHGCWRAGRGPAPGRAAAPAHAAGRARGGPGVTGLADRGRCAAARAHRPGAALRLPHARAPALALAALPLALTETPGPRARRWPSLLCLALQWGRGPLAAPGALALVFDLALAILAGLSLSAQWHARRERRGPAAARLLPVRRPRLGGRALGVGGGAGPAAADAGRARRASWPWP